MIAEIGKQNLAALGPPEVSLIEEYRDIPMRDGEFLLTSLSLSNTYYVYCHILETFVFDNQLTFCRLPEFN